MAHAGPRTFTDGSLVIGDTEVTCVHQSWTHASADPIGILAGTLKYQPTTRSEFSQVACSSYKCRHETNRRGNLGYSLRTRRQSRPHAKTRSRSKAPAFALTRASDATIMPPAPSDHYMREATTALRTVSATLGPQLLVVVEVLRALSGLVRRNA